MDLPGVSIADEGETGMFSLRTIGKTRVRLRGRQLAPHRRDGQCLLGAELEGWWALGNEEATGE